MDGNPFAPRDGAEETIDGQAHVREPHRIVQMIEHRVQEAARELGVAQPALAEETSDRRFDGQGGGQGRGRLFVTGLVVPAGGEYPSEALRLLADTIRHGASSSAPRRTR